MPSTTRREVLAATTAGIAALAGCTTGSDSSNRRVPEPRGEPIEYAVEHVRDGDGAVLFSRADRTETPTDVRRARHGSTVLTSAAELEEYAFGSVEAAQRLADYVAATDFDSQSVFLYQTGIVECDDLRVTEVRLDGDDHPRVSMCRSERAADVSCSAEARDTVGLAVRIPIPGEELTGFGTSSGRCDDPGRPPAFTANVTVTDGDGQ